VMHSFTDATCALPYFTKLCSRQGAVAKSAVWTAEGSVVDRDPQRWRDKAVIIHCTNSCTKKKKT